MNAASVVDEFRMLLKRVIFESSRRRRTHLAHIKPLNPNKNPSFIFFTERMITIKTNFLNSGSASCLATCDIFTVVVIFFSINRYFGILVSFAIECISGHISPSLHVSLLKTATKVAPLQRRCQGWKYLKSPKFLRLSVTVSVNGSLQYSDVN